MPALPPTAGAPGPLRPRPPFGPCPCPWRPWPRGPTSPARPEGTGLLVVDPGAGTVPVVPVAGVVPVAPGVGVPPPCVREAEPAANAVPDRPRPTTSAAAPAARATVLVRIIACSTPLFSLSSCAKLCVMALSLVVVASYFHAIPNDAPVGAVSFRMGVVPPSCHQYGEGN